MTTTSLLSRRRPGTCLSLALSACLSAVLLALPLSAQAAFPGQNGSIAFDHPGEEGGIFSIDPRRGEKRFLTRGTSVEYSPDGRRIAYVGEQGIYVANADGSDPQPVTHDGSDPYRSTYEVNWSPDGRSLVFVRLEEVGGGYFLYTVRVDGSRERWLDEGRESAWSPDGRLIAYTIGNDLFVVRPDGTGRRRLTSTRHSFSDLDWAPDGRSLVAVRDLDGQGPGVIGSPPNDVVRISRSGRRLGRIVSRRDISASALSPDGRRLVFQRFVRPNGAGTPGEDRLYVVSARGGRPRALTAGRDPSWQPVRPSAARTRSSR